MAARFTKEMKIFEALQTDPGVREILARHGMGCVGCMGATMETLENGAKMHGISLDSLLGDLNGLNEKKEA